MRAARRPIRRSIRDTSGPFPLSAKEIEDLRRFGTVRRYADGESLFETGKPGPGMFILLSGHVAITQRDASATSRSWLNKDLVGPRSSRPHWARRW
jgi:CRP-like cAMP-binding protein